MSNHLNRRDFINTTVVSGAALGAMAQTRSVLGANEKLVVAVMGTNGRGVALARNFAKNEGAEIGYVCDVDENAVRKGLKSVSDAGQQAVPKVIKDFRKALDDKDVDILVCAAPNHWHGPATILGCSAGKHVYVEKPCCHNPREGEMMIEVARKNKCVVQMGNQRRSGAEIIEGIKMIHEGVIGRVYYSRSWYANTRGSIGRGKKMDPPKNLDFDLWQGPAPRQPFVSNLVHYSWHWRWHWGNGELGNNGIHSIDLSRWGLQVDYPIRVTSAGGRYHWNDDQQTPDTHAVTFDFQEGKTITWEGLSCNRRGPDGTGFGASFHGEKGTIVIDGAGYTHYSATNREQKKVAGKISDAGHVANFLDCIRTGKQSNSDIDGAHKSTLLCHLGNISHRVKRTLNCDAKNGHIVGDDDAMGFWARDYEPGWEPKV